MVDKRVASVIVLWTDIGGGWVVADSIDVIAVSFIQVAYSSSEVGGP